MELLAPLAKPTSSSPGCPRPWNWRSSTTRKRCWLQNRPPNILFVPIRMDVPVRIKAARLQRAPLSPKISELMPTWQPRRACENPRAATVLNELPITSLPFDPWEFVCCEEILFPRLPKGRHRRPVGARRPQLFPTLLPRSEQMPQDASLVGCGDEEGVGADHVRLHPSVTGCIAPKFVREV